LESLKEKLNTKGRIWISTPNPRSILIRGFGKYARDIDFPRHKQIYSILYLEKLFNELSLEHELIRPPIINFIFNYYSCVLNIINDKEISLKKKIFIIFNYFLKTIYLFLKDIIKHENNPTELVFIIKNKT
jgi:hypothetical protein